MAHVKGTPSEDLNHCYWCDRPRNDCACASDPSGLPADHWSKQPAQSRNPLGNNLPMTPQRIRDAAQILGELGNSRMANELIALADNFDRNPQIPTELVCGQIHAERTKG